MQWASIQRQAPRNALVRLELQPLHLNDADADTSTAYNCILAVASSNISDSSLSLSTAISQDLTAALNTTVPVVRTLAAANLCVFQLAPASTNTSEPIQSINCSDSACCCRRHQPSLGAHSAAVHSQLSIAAGPRHSQRSAQLICLLGCSVLPRRHVGFRAHLHGGCRHNRRRHRQKQRQRVDCGAGGGRGGAVCCGADGLCHLSATRGSAAIHRLRQGSAAALSCSVCVIMRQMLSSI